MVEYPRFYKIVTPALHGARHHAKLQDGMMHFVVGNEPLL